MQRKNTLQPIENYKSVSLLYNYCSSQQKKTSNHLFLLKKKQKAQFLLYMIEYNDFCNLYYNVQTRTCQ